MREKTLPATFAQFVSLNIFGMLGLSCYILADTFFVANGLGTNGLAALNLAIPIYSFVHAAGLMLGIGGAIKGVILKAQSNEKANEVFTHSLLLGLFFGAAFLALGLCAAEPLSRALGANGDTLAMTATYIKTILCFAPCFIANNVLLAFIRNDDAPRLAMGGMLLGSFSNIILDYVFVFPLGMGMFGAAFATGLAPVISVSLLSVHFIRRKNSFHLHKCSLRIKTLMNILSLGAASFITEVSSGVVLVVFNIVILRIAGNIGVAAYGVVANLSLVAVSIFVGVAQGMQPLVSARFGQGDHRQLKELLRYALVLALAISALLYAVVNIFGGPIISAFNSEASPALAAYAREGLLLYFIGFLFAGVNIVTIAFLSASQSPQKAFLLSSMRGFAAILPLVALLPRLWGITGVWLVFPCAEMLTTIITVSIFAKKNTE